MAANFIVTNSQFKPFSYSEMLAPVAMATEAHQDVESQFSDLASKSNVWEELANEQTDPVAYNMYQKYSDDLKAQAATLASQGLNPATRQGMLGMRERYTKEITPIENAYTRRTAEAQRQQEMRDKDSSIIFDRTASTTSLDEYLKNPNLDYRGLSVNEVYTTASRDFAETAKKMQKEGKWKTALGGQYWEQINRSGATPEEITALIAGDPNAPKELKDLYDNTLSSYMSRGQWNDKDKAAIKNAIDRAAIYGIGEVSTRMQGNQEYLNPLQRQQLQKSRETENQPSGGDRLPYTAIPRTTVNGKTKTSEIQEDMNFIKAIIANPAMIKSQGMVRGPQTVKQIGNTAVYQEGELEERNPYLRKFQELSKRYPDISFDISDNATNMLPILEQLEEEIKVSAVRDFEYTLNYTDNSLANSTIQRNADIMSTRGTIPMYKYDGQTVSSKPYSEKEYNKINFETGNISYDPNINKIIYTYKDKDANLKRAVIDTEVLDDKDRSLATIQKNIDIAKKNKDYENFNIFVDQFMKRMDAKFNTMAKIQSNTDATIKDITLE